jgi:hypothetical protein
MIQRASPSTQATTKSSSYGTASKGERIQSKEQKEENEQQRMKVQPN